MQTKVKNDFRCVVYVTLIKILQMAHQIIATNESENSQN